MSCDNINYVVDIFQDLPELDDKVEAAKLKDLPAVIRHLRWASRNLTDGKYNHHFPTRKSKKYSKKILKILLSYAEDDLQCQVESLKYGPFGSGHIDTLWG